MITFLLFLLKSVEATIGPMARDVDSLVLCMQALLNDDMFHLDPSIPPMPFNMQVCYLTTRFALNILRKLLHWEK